MKKVRTQEAVGHVLCHDITKIVPGEFKGRAFKKGHIVTEADVPELLNLGKDHLYIWEQVEGSLHEDQAALRLAQAAAGPNVTLSSVHEGRINLLAQVSGLCKVNKELLTKVNSQAEIILATRHTNSVVHRGELLAGTRVVPLVIPEAAIEVVEELCRDRFIIEVKPLQNLRVGLITTGSEVFYGRIKDAFGPVLRQKFAELGSQVVQQVFVPDDLAQIKSAIEQVLLEGVDLIAVSGGMSVDPDDLTPGAIRATGAEIVCQGAPVLPGSQFLLGYLQGKPIVGLPGCVMYSKATVFDLVVPRLLAGEEVTWADLVELGHGGMCLQCTECNYPVCPFGKC